jgi:adenylate cyclase
MFGRELGVRYVLEGSVRKAGSRVRITGQLVEAATGTHLWADRFDGTLEDVFDLQDQVTASVVAAIQPNLLTAEIQRAQRKPPENLQAYDLMLRADPYFLNGTRDDMAEAARLLQKAVTIDPAYAPGLAYLALCHWMTVSQGWMDRRDPAVAEMIQLARAALALDDNDHDILRIAGVITALPGGDLSGGIDALIARSISLNPNDAIAIAAAGLMHAYAGDTASAISCLDRSGRLNPHSRAANFHLGYALAHFVAGEHEAVVEWSAKGLQLRPNRTPLLRYRAASFGLLDRLNEGRQAVQQLLELIPDFTIARARRHIELDMNNIFKTPGVADSFYEGLRRSGVSE